MGSYTTAKFFLKFLVCFLANTAKFYLPVLSCSPTWAFLRRKTIYFLSENGSSKPSPRISHSQLELDKLPYVITRLSQFAMDGMQDHSWENAWRAAQPLKMPESLTKPQLLPPQTHPNPHRHPRTPPAVPGALCTPLFSLFCHPSKLDQHF